MNCVSLFPFQMRISFFFPFVEPGRRALADKMRSSSPALAAPCHGSTAVGQDRPERTVNRAACAGFGVSPQCPGMPRAYSLAIMTNGQCGVQKYFLMQ